MAPESPPLSSLKGKHNPVQVDQEIDDDCTAGVKLVHYYCMKKCKNGNDYQVMLGPQGAIWMGISRIKIKQQRI